MFFAFRDGEWMSASCTEPFLKIQNKVQSFDYFVADFVCGSGFAVEL